MLSRLRYVDSLLPLAGVPKTGSAVRYGISCSALYEVFCRLLGSERDEAEKADIHTCVLRLLITESHFAGVSCNPICFFLCSFEGVWYTTVLSVSSVR